MNKPTEWKPAPEDVQEHMTEITCAVIKTAEITDESIRKAFELYK